MENNYNCLAPIGDEINILNRSIEHCNYLYNHLINPDTNVLSNTAIFNEESNTELLITRY